MTTDHITNEEILQMAGTSRLQDIIAERRWGWQGMSCVCP